MDQVILIHLLVGGGEGIPGPQGPRGPKGDPGENGTDGANGKSAFQQAVDAGYTGTEAEFYAALVTLQNAPFVSLNGTSVVTGDLQVPTPATERSAVPKSYADTKLSKDGGTVTGLTRFNNGAIVTSFNASLVFGYCKLATVRITQSWANFNLFISFTQNKRKSISTVCVCFKNKNSVDPDLNYFTQIGEGGDAYIHKSDVSTWDIYIIKGETNTSVQILNLMHDLRAMNVSFANESIETLPEGSIKATDYVPDQVKFYADAVPYQYAKAAGFPGSETIYKRNLAYQPTFFYENTTLFNAPGIVKIASAIRTNIESNLILEGAIRNMSATNMFRIVINQRAAVTNNNFVTFEGIGNLPPASFVNLIVTKNDSGLIEVYVEATSTSSSYAMIVFKVYVERVNHWTLRENPALEFTSGTIPGTKVWDLKSAWSNTSRTQITKEEIQAGTTVNGVQTLNEVNILPSLTIPGLNPSSNVFLLTGPSKTDIRGRVWYRAEQLDLTQLPELQFLAAYKNEDGSWGSAQNLKLKGLADPTSPTGAVNLRTLQSYVASQIASLKAELTAST